MDKLFDKDVLWRTGRAIVASALAQTLVLQPDFSDPAKAFQVLWASFVTGIFMGVSKFLRDNWGNAPEAPKKEQTTTGTVINNLPV